MSEERILEIKIIKYTWLTGLAGSVVLFLVSAFKFILPISYFLGVMVGLMCFNLKRKTIDKGMKPENLKFLKKLLIRRRMMNTLIYMATLGISAYSQYYRGDRDLHLNVFATFAGLLTLKVVIYVKFLIVDKIKEKKKAKEETLEKEEGENKND